VAILLLNFKLSGYQTQRLAYRRPSLMG